MSRKRDPKAPKDLTDEQRQMLCRDPYLTDLRRQRDVLRRDMCYLTRQNSRSMICSHATEGMWLFSVGRRQGSANVHSQIGLER